MKLNALTACDLAAKLARREVTCEAVVRDCLERIALREPQVAAWVCLDAEQVIARARLLDQSSSMGLLHGLPIGVKDIIDTADAPTEYGSPIYRRHRPAADAACVAMTRRAGALILGKTVTTEFATSTPRGTRNPHNPAHTPGGSSSGSAAAVADFMVPLAFGTQTGGSTLRPASYCGVVGYKPTFGLINRTGIKPLSDSLDTVGLIARTVQDAGLLAAGASGCAELADIAVLPRPRVGLWRGPEWRHAEPATMAAVDAAAGALERAGAKVSDADVPAELASLAEAHHDIEYFEMARGFAWELDHHRSHLSAAFLARLEQGARCSLDRYDTARQHAVRCRGLLAAVMAEHDVLLCPAAPGEAPEGLASTGSAVFNSTWTLLHAACISVPGYTGPRGLPVGVQLVAEGCADRRLLAAAAFTSGHLH
ncbi:MAG: amidase [Burkholderiales bacterium]|nr:amidase [Burkholderiales bacterium]